MLWPVELGALIQLAPLPNPPPLARVGEPHEGTKGFGLHSPREYISGIQVSPPFPTLFVPRASCVIASLGSRLAVCPFVSGYGTLF